MRQMEDHELESEQKLLTACIMVTALGQDMNDATVQRIEEIIVDHRTRLRTQGLDFPELVPIVLPRNGTVDVVVRDMDIRGIEVTIVNLTRKYPSVSREDLAFGIGRAFPEYVKRVAVASKNRSWTHH